MAWHLRTWTRPGKQISHQQRVDPLTVPRHFFEKKSDCPLSPWCFRNVQSSTLLPPWSLLSKRSITPQSLTLWLETTFWIFNEVSSCIVTVEWFVFLKGNSMEEKCFMIACFSSIKGSMHNRNDTSLDLDQSRQHSSVIIVFQNALPCHPIAMIAWHLRTLTSPGQQISHQPMVDTQTSVDDDLFPSSQANFQWAMKHGRPTVQV